MYICIYTIYIYITLSLYQLRSLEKGQQLNNMLPKT